MTQFGFERQTRFTIQSAANDFDANVCCPLGAARGPCVVTLESGIQALVEIASFTYVEDAPLAIGAGLAENVHPADFVERGPDGIRLKGVKAPGVSGAS